MNEWMNNAARHSFERFIYILDVCCFINTKNSRSWPWNNVFLKSYRLNKLGDICEWYPSFLGFRGPEVLRQSVIKAGVSLITWFFCVPSFMNSPLLDVATHEEKNCSWDTRSKKRHGFWRLRRVDEFTMVILIFFLEQEAMW